MGTPASAADQTLTPTQAMQRFLRCFHVLLRSSRLYQKNHPRTLESLIAAERSLRAALDVLPQVACEVQRDTLSAPLLREHPLPDPRGELRALATELAHCGISSICFLPSTNLGELDLFSQLLNGPDGVPSGPARSKTVWAERLAQRHVVGIRVNEPVDRQMDTALAGLVAALLAYSGAGTAAEGGAADSPSDSAALGSARKPGTPGEVCAVVHLLARMASPLGPTQENSPQEAVRAFHEALAETDRQTVDLLAAVMFRHAPRDAEKPERYVVRIAEILVLEFLEESFCSRKLAAPDVRGQMGRLARALAAGIPRNVTKSGNLRAGFAALTPWNDEAYLESLHERFWAELAAREKAAVLRGTDAWCVPAGVLARHLEQLCDTAHPAAETSPREARLVLLNYAGCLEAREASARQAVAGGLAELLPLVERLWPNQLPEELGGGIVRALVAETTPAVAGMLAAVTEKLARLALARGDYSEFERIFAALEQGPHDAEHAHLDALARQLVNDESWLLLVDAALDYRPLDTVLPRLLRRNPERLLDRLGLLLTVPEGLDALPAMARLLRAIGEPALSTLEIRLFEPRRQRATAAVKLLAAAAPERLVAQIPRALPSWDWNVQDLAVCELARAGVPAAAGAFLTVLAEAHPLVVPMMLDEIGLAGEARAVPLLMEIAAGEHPVLRDIFLRIKAIEALGRLRAVEAAELLRYLLEERSGLTHLEPSGLRAAAEEALALVENRPSSSRLRAAYEALEKSSLAYARPRRYPRVPLSSPLTAQIEGLPPGTARVRTISLGGAFLESNRRLAIGDSIHLEIRAGLRRIQSTAVVRNVAPNGEGVEFVHMKEEDRERLRRLVRRRLRE